MSTVDPNAPWGNDRIVRLVGVCASRESAEAHAARLRVRHRVQLWVVEEPSRCGEPDDVSYCIYGPESWRAAPFAEVGAER